MEGAKKKTCGMSDVADVLPVNISCEFFPPICNTQLTFKLHMNKQYSLGREYMIDEHGYLVPTEGDLPDIKIKGSDHAST